MTKSLFLSRRTRLFAVFLAAAGATGAAATGAHHVKVVDGIVQPVRPMVQAIDEAIQFLRKADGQYVPGDISGDLAGYFTSALVQPDGSRSKRLLAFPARHHAYFIRTFLDYYAYTGEREWLLRARDLADWNIAHSTPPDCPLPNLPYSSFENGKPTGSQDKNSTEPDKAAFIGTYYLALYEATADARYLDAAEKIAATVIKWQREDGSVPFRIVPTDGSIFQDLGGAPVYYVEFFERLQRHSDRPEYRTSGEKATRCMLARNVERGEWGTYHEDVKPRDGSHLSAEPMSFTADYLFRNTAAHPEYLEMGRKVLRQMEAKLVYTEGHAASPAPAVAEQATYMHIMPGHTARYCLALADEYRVTRDDAIRRRALSGLNAVTYMQSPAGLFRTYFYDTRKQQDGGSGKPDWYSQHLYTVCHLLETTVVFPERVPNGENRLLHFTTTPYDVAYGNGVVRFATRLPGREALKLAAKPHAVRVDGRALPEQGASADPRHVAGLGEAGPGSATPATNGRAAPLDGWTFQPSTRVLTLQHPAGRVTIE